MMDLEEFVNSLVISELDNNDENVLMRLMESSDHNERCIFRWEPMGLEFQTASMVSVGNIPCMEENVIQFTVGGDLIDGIRYKLVDQNGLQISVAPVRAYVAGRNIGEENWFSLMELNTKFREWKFLCVPLVICHKCELRMVMVWPDQLIDIEATIKLEGHKGYLDSPKRQELASKGVRYGNILFPGNGYITDCGIF